MQSELGKEEHTGVIPEARLTICHPVQNLRQHQFGSNRNLPSQRYANLLLAVPPPDSIRLADNRSVDNFSMASLEASKHTRRNESPKKKQGRSTRRGTRARRRQFAFQTPIQRQIDNPHQSLEMKVPSIWSGVQWLGSTKSVFPTMSVPDLAIGTTLSVDWLSLLTRWRN